MSSGHYARNRVEARLHLTPLSAAYRIAGLRPHPDWLTRRSLEPFAVRSVPSRFCDGQSSYAVLYAAAQLQTAFLETLVRDRFVQRQERRIPFTDVTSRGWIQYATIESPFRKHELASPAGHPGAEAGCSSRSVHSGKPN
jgi:hypothetical protein